MRNLPSRTNGLVAQMRLIREPSRPTTFIEALQQSFAGIWCFTMVEGMQYLQAFKEILVNKSNISWEMLENDEILLELQDYAFTYIPKNPGGCFDTDLEFHDVQPGDVSLCVMSDMEIKAFQKAVDAACWASDGALKRDDWVTKGMTPVACLSWVLMWCMIVWRSDAAHEYLQKGYDLEIRKDWTVVACPRKSDKQLAQEATDRAAQNLKLDLGPYPVTQSRLLD